ncbi:Methylosome protein 50 [Harpegnathos saltator]|uniref:Methylosome protein 50 n=2 Tax=Harpegnathos saltator TaxID=610380 RepID=E2B7J7_HARSA|nr:Methylosome protein 50 [Harpegnathos saltator]
MFKEALLTSPNFKSYPQFLLIDYEYKALVGTINMSSMTWSGSIKYYNDITDFGSKNATITKDTYDGCGDAVFLAEDKFVIVGDRGAIEIFKIAQSTNEFETPEFQSLNYACHHDDSVYTVSAFSDKKSIITGGLDCCIRIWDVDSFIATQTYTFAHTDNVTATDVKPMCNYVFASTSFSGDTLIWDIRQSKPGLCILDRKGKYYSVSWNPTMDQFVAVGGDDGTIALMDVRQPNEPLFEPFLHNSGLWKVLFNPDPMRKEQLACCFDSTCVKVLDVTDDMNLIIEDNQHTDYVRGLAWYKDNLFSCGWDDNVIKRVVPLSSDR